MARLHPRPTDRKRRRPLTRAGLAAVVLAAEEAFALAAETGLEVAVVVVVRPTGESYHRPQIAGTDPSQR